MDPGVHGALTACVCLCEQNLFQYATHWNKVCFCRQVSARHWSDCHENLALLCPDREANVQLHSKHPNLLPNLNLNLNLQIYCPTKTFSNFHFPFASVFRMPSEACTRLGKWRIDRSASKRSSWKVERSAITAFFLEPWPSSIVACSRAFWSAFRNKGQC